MASKLIQINKDGCPLSSCKIGTFSLEVGEEVKITLNGKNPDWPAFIVGEVVAVDPYTKGSGWSYTVDIEEDDLNGGPMFEDCDIEVACYSCCDALDERVTALENVVPDPDTNTTYTYSGNGIFVPSDGGPNVDASDLLDDTVIDTSATYEVINGVLTIPTVDAAGNPTGNSLTVNIPDKFGTNTDNGNGTNSNTDGNGVTVCNVACPPAGTPAGAVPSTDGSGAVTWAVPVPAQLDISFERVGDDLVLEVDSNNDQLEINGAFNFISTIAGVFTDNDTQDISVFNGTITGDTVDISHTAGGVTSPLQFTLGDRDLRTVSNPDGSTTIYSTTAAGVEYVVGVIPSAAEDDDSNNVTETAPDPITGAVTYTHVPSGVDWTITPPATYTESEESDFIGSAVAGTYDRNVGNQDTKLVGHFASEYDTEILTGAAGSTLSGGTHLEKDALFSEEYESWADRESRKILVDLAKGNDTRTHDVGSVTHPTSKYDQFRPFLTVPAAYAAAEDKDYIEVIGNDHAGNVTFGIDKEVTIDSSAVQRWAGTMTINGDGRINLIAPTTEFINGISMTDEGRLRAKVAQFKSIAVRGNAIAKVWADEGFIDDELDDTPSDTNRNVYVGGTAAHLHIIMNGDAFTRIVGGAGGTDGNATIENDNGRLVIEVNGSVSTETDFMNNGCIQTNNGSSHIYINGDLTNVVATPTIDETIVYGSAANVTANGNLHLEVNGLITGVGAAIFARGAAKVVVTAHQGIIATHSRGENTVTGATSLGVVYASDENTHVVINSPFVLAEATTEGAVGVVNAGAILEWNVRHTVQLGVGYGNAGTPANHANNSALFVIGGNNATSNSKLILRGDSYYHDKGAVGEFIHCSFFGGSTGEVIFENTGGITNIAAPLTAGVVGNNTGQLVSSGIITAGQTVTPDVLR